MPLYLKLLHAALATEVEAVLPIIMLLLIVGVTTATLQAIFQMEDTALNLLPKTVVMILIGIFGGFGALDLFKSLIVAWIGNVGLLVHQSWS
ncbi:flagellar biosynthetic protein FliQ [Acidisoma sp.]|uniref:flagellar biosynthetic protein FliQ n=1 Tax=Acidisoma sp. TaxID=1872115 RepID=UPI003B00B81F